MSHEHGPDQSGLISSGNRGLATRSSGLVQRGMDLLRDMHWKRLVEDGKLCCQRGRYTEAEKLFLSALNEAEALGSESCELTVTLTNLVMLYRAQGDYAKARSLYLRSLSIEAAMAVEKGIEAMTSLTLAEACHALGDDAIRMEEDAIGIYARTLGPDHPNVAMCAYIAAEFYRIRGDSAVDHGRDVFIDAGKEFYGIRGYYTEAEWYYELAIDVYEKAYGLDYPGLIAVLLGLSETCRAQGNSAKSETLYRRAMTLKKKHSENIKQVFEPAYADLALRLCNLAVQPLQDGEYSRAEYLLKRSLGMFEQALGPDHNNVSAALFRLAVAYCGQRRYDEAEPLIKRRLEINEKVYGPDHLEVAASLEEYTLLLQKTNRKDEAALIDDRVKSIRAKHACENQPEIK